MAINALISWSGSLSKQIATHLRTDLSRAMQRVDFWMSDEDMLPGLAWASQLSHHLAKARFAILCVTAENAETPWMMFEAGAVSNTVGGNFVVPYLFGLSRANLRGPLAQFQAVEADEQGTRSLFRALNEATDAERLTDSELEDVFSIWWPTIRGHLGQVRADSETEAPERPDRELLEEILELVRQQRRAEHKTAYIPEAPLWTPEDFKERSSEEIAEFFRSQLMPEVLERARREWDRVEARDLLTKIHLRALELAQERAGALGLRDQWDQWRLLRSDRATTS